ncbi:MAG TPA: SDR family oxidoreductase [Pelolinea sp.]|nr:SDR family oxidoreductase [Pelolinea sp.]
MKLPEELQFIQNSRMPQKTTNSRMDGKICVITGATSGIGYEAAKRLAQGGAHIVMVCRSKEKALKVQEELAREFDCTVDIFIADFLHLAEVSLVADEISKKYPKIDVLINNAGMFNKRRRLTPDGNEMVFQVIHLASFLITRVLADNLKSGAPSRILDINSEAHRFGGLNIQDLTWARRPYIGLRAYGAAKIAQLLVAWELADQLKGSGVTINAMHPGAVRTNIGMNNGILYRLYNRFILRWFLKDPAISGEAIYYLAAAPELEKVSGRFFNQTIEEKPASHALDRGLGGKVWEISEQLIMPNMGGER